MKSNYISVGTLVLMMLILGGVEMGETLSTGRVMVLIFLFLVSCIARPRRSKIPKSEPYVNRDMRRNR